MTIAREATSYPSLFHWDLAYLEALRQPTTADLPQPWKGRVQAWRTLVRLWLLGELDEQTVSLPEPFVQYLPRTADGVPAWVRSATWLSRDGSIIGVGSQSVLVRPLPDADSALPVWTWPAEPSRDQKVGAILAHLISAIDVLETAQPDAGLKELGQILRNQFPGVAGSPPPDLPACEHVVANVRSLKHTGLRFRRGKAAARTLVPFCKCGLPLVPNEARVRAGETSIAITCASGHVNSLELESLCCAWYGRPSALGGAVRRNRLVAWSNRPPSVNCVAESGFPAPVRTTGERSLEFVYGERDDVAFLGRPEQQRTLSLIVDQGCVVEALRTQDVLFGRPLVPAGGQGDPRTEVLPVKLEYVDLCERGTKFEEHSVDLALRGLPAPVNMAIVAAAEGGPVAAVLIPDPEICPPGWRKFWVAASDRYQVQVPGCEASQRLDLDLEASPTALALRREGDADVGCTVRLAPPGAAGDTIPVTAALDFGTTSSVLYLETQGAMGGAQHSALRPAGLRQGRAARWLLGNATLGRAAADQLLPVADDTADPASVASEICRNHRRVQWAQKPCCPPSDVASYIKAEATAGPLRIEYISQILTLGLCQQLALCQGRAKGLRLRPIFGFPLTFTDDDRARYRKEVTDALDILARWTGMDQSPVPHFIDESSAGVLSVGAYSDSELVLVADLGGGTLDLSMGVGAAYGQNAPVPPEWIGSLDFGGRYLLRAIGHNDDAKERQLQAAIRRSDPSGAEAFRSKPNVEALVRFTSAIVSYLGTMLHARLVSAPGPARVNVLLLGKGWQFWRLTAADRVAHDQYFRSRMKALCEAIQRYLNGRLGSAISVVWANAASDVDPKHAVARGALRAGDRSIEATVRLPAGVTVRQGPTTVAWTAPIGPGPTAGAILDAGVQFGRDEFNARLEAHRTAMKDSGILTPFPGPMEEADEAPLRFALTDKDNAAGAAGMIDSGYFRGPLQLLMEGIWRTRL